MLMLLIITTKQVYGTDMQSADSSLRPLTFLYCDCRNGWSRSQSFVCYTGLYCAQFERGKRSFPRGGNFQQCVSLQVLILSQYGRPHHELFSRGKRCCRLWPFSVRRRRLASHRHSKYQLQSLSSLVLLPVYVSVSVIHDWDSLLHG